MKISQREKLLLMILVIVAFGYIFFQFINAPQMDKIAVLKDETQKLQETKDKIKLDTAKRKKIIEQTKGINLLIKKEEETYFGNLHEEEIIIIVNDILKEAGVECNSISFSDIKSFSDKSSEKSGEKDKKGDEENKKSADEDKKNDGEKKEEEKNEASNVEFQCVDVGLSIAGSYENIEKLIGILENHKPKIYLNNVTFSYSPDKMMVSMSIQFYGLKGVNDKKYDTKSNEKLGKDNPFNDLGVASNYKEKETEDKENNYNFGLTIKPVSADLPAVVLGCLGTNSQSTYVTSDINGEQDVNIVFSEKDGKLFFKYKSDTSSYPKDYETLGEEFKIDGDINILVVSSKRNSKDDLAKVNIVIENNTSKKVYITVKNDDPEESRFKLSTVKGQVIKK